MGSMKNLYMILISILATTLPITSIAFAQTPYEKIKLMLKHSAEKNPKNARVIVVGQSDSGDLIYGLEIGHGPTHNLVVATHHGNEYGSTVVAGYFGDALAGDPIADQTVFVVPVLNISGYNGGNRRETLGASTYDPNRDYPGPCGTEGPFKLKSTASLAKFIEANKIVASSTLHTFFPGVLYPWGISTQDTQTPYDNIFVQLGKAATIESGYLVGNSTKELYPADGTFEDYSFWKLGIWSMLFEMGNTHSPSNAQLQELIRFNLPGLRRMMMVAPKIRAERHAFSGNCDVVRGLDKHNE